MHGVARACTAVLLVGAAACTRDGSTLIVYTSLDGDLVERVGESFEARHAGADVRFVKLDDEAALAQLAAERGDPRADVWWGASDVDLARAAAQDLLSAPEGGMSEAGAGVRGNTQGLWRATMASPLVLVFHRDRVSLGRAPLDWRDLQHPRWLNELALVDPVLHVETRAFLFGIMLEEARRTGVLDAGFDWLLRLDASTGIYASDLAGLESLLRGGEASVTILPLHQARELEHRSLVSWRVPESGSPALIRGVGMVAGSAQPELAAAFIEHLMRDEAVAEVIETRGWVVTPDGVDPAGVDWDEGRLAGLSLWAGSPDTVLAEGSRWMQHWSREIRGRGGPSVR